MYNFRPLAFMAAVATLLPSAFCTFNAAANSNMAVYWGQGPNQQRLSHFCADTNIDIIQIAFLNVFPDQSGGYPGTNFGNQCGAQTYKNPSGSSSPLLSQCPYIGSDIQTCQKMGKKILLSLGGAIPNNQHISSTTSAINFAKFLWRAFGPDKESATSTFPRPFGNAVVDGFDFDIENILVSGENSADLNRGYGTMITTLRNLYALDKSKSYYISGAPQCLIPDTHLANAIETSWFDFLFVQFYNTPSCSARAFFDHSYGGQNTNISFDKWISFVKASSFNKNVKVYLGLPASNSNQVVYDSKMYLAPSEANAIIEAFQCKYPTNFGGVMVFEATYSEMNSINGKPYVDVLKGYLKGTGCATKAQKMIKRVVVEPDFPTAIPTEPIEGLAPSGLLVTPPGGASTAANSGKASATASACGSSTYSSTVCGTVGLFTGDTNDVGGSYGVASVQDCEALCLQNDQCETIQYSSGFGMECDLYGNTAKEGGFEANQYGSPVYERGCFDTGKGASSCSSTKTSSASPSSTASLTKSTQSASMTKSSGTAPLTRSTGTAPYSSGVYPSGASSGFMPSGSGGPFPMSNSSSPASTASGGTAPLSSGGNSSPTSSGGKGNGGFPSMSSGGKSVPTATGGEETISVTEVFTITSCAPDVTNCPARTHPIVTTVVVPISIATFPAQSGSPQTTQEVVVTDVVTSYVTTCPYTHTTTIGGSQVVETGTTTSTVFKTYTSTICTKCVAPPTPAPTTDEVTVTEIVTTYTTTCPFSHTTTIGGSQVVSTGTTVSVVVNTIISTITLAPTGSPSSGNGSPALPGALGHGAGNAQAQASVPASGGLSLSNLPSSPEYKSPSLGEQVMAGFSPSGPAIPAQAVAAGSTPASAPKTVQETVNIVPVQTGAAAPVPANSAETSQPGASTPSESGSTGNSPVIPAEGAQSSSPSAPSSESGQTGSQPPVPGQVGQSGSSAPFPATNGTGSASPSGSARPSGTTAPQPTVAPFTGAASRIGGGAFGLVALFVAAMFML